ncbi:MAG TPA: short-chain dehydrogenase [Flavisolibacter sp.]|nr:short-chain dehydrogenase [Flavisolibacter sp.]
MNIEQIESFLHKKTTEENSYVKISFKKRDAVYGLFVKDRDYADLKSKNFWRIVTRSHFDNYNKTKDMKLARIFSGTDFSRLTLHTETFED